MGSSQSPRSWVARLACLVLLVVRNLLSNSSQTITITATHVLRFLVSACACTPAARALLQVAVVLLAARHSPAAIDYVLVIDCGSSGSRITAFEVTPSHTGSPLPRLSPLPPTAATSRNTQPSDGLLTDRIQTTPGLAVAYQADTRWGVRQSLKPLLDWAEAAIPPEQHASTALLICATAGVRGLPLSEQQVCICRTPSHA